MSKERIQKILARAGIASRRGAEELIREGRVMVNGKIAELGDQADPEKDFVKLDGKRVASSTGPRHYFVAFKPRSMVTTLDDPEGRPTIKDLLRSHRIREKVYPVGRLDWDADGLLFLTNDGDLAHQVMHPRRHLPKLYRVKVRGCPDERALRRLRQGVRIDRGPRTLPAEVQIEKEGQNASWVQVTLVEGRQNQIKKMFEGVGHPVRRLRRMAIGPLRLGKLKVGQVRRLTEKELELLRKDVAGTGRKERPARKKSKKKPREA